MYLGMQNEAAQKIDVGIFQKLEQASNSN